MKATRVQMAVLWAVSLTIPGLAMARSMSAFNGIASTPIEASCWAHGGGAITNTCSTTKRWCMPLEVDAPGTHNVWVNVYASDPNHNVGCFAVGLTRDLSTVWQSSQLYTPVFGSAYMLSLSAYLPSEGALYACCDVNPGGRINTVNWSV